MFKFNCFKKYFLGNYVSFYLFKIFLPLKKDLEICQGDNCYLLIYSFILKYKKCHILGIISLKMNLKFAALLGDEVRHNIPKFDICRKVFFWRPCNVNIEFFTSSFHRPKFQTHLQKNLGGRGVNLKDFGEKKCFPQKVCRTQDV